MLLPPALATRAPGALRGSPAGRPTPWLCPLRLPGFHKAYLQASVEMFGRCTQRTVDKLAAAAHSAQASGQVW